jgi:transcriptional regulator
VYTPSAFAETDRGKLHDFIESHSFGLLVSTEDGIPRATHLPLLLQCDAGPHGSLLGHVARANPQWRGLDGQQVLVVFSGPHAYVSPTWYESENVVPTWNYVAVHAYGTVRLVEDPEALTRILTAMVARYEGSLPKPWSFDPGSAYVQKQVRAVVGFRIEISRLEGKWKLNQNHPEERRDRVMRVLAQSKDHDAREIARLMMDGRALTDRPSGV